jgi:hypothetical protein
MFASDVHHTVDMFVSQFFTPGCVAVDSLRLDWSHIVKEDQAIWAFPPLQCLSATISLIEKYRVEALLCMPIKAGSNEIIQIRQMEHAEISGPLVVPRKSSSIVFLTEESHQEQ